MRKGELTSILPYEAKKGEIKKVLLLYSGGLKSIVALRWLQKYYKAQVIVLVVDLGQTKHNMAAIAKQAEKAGADRVISYDGKEEFTNDFIAPAIKANVAYEVTHNLLQPLSITFLGKLAAEIAKKEGIEAVAHGSSMRASDNVRYDGIMRTINPDIKIIAVARHIGTSRQDFINFAKEEKLTFDAGIENKYTYEENIWGVDIAGGNLDDPSAAPDYEDVLLNATPKEKAPDTPQTIHIRFENGLPVALDGKEMSLYDLIKELNVIGGKHGVGIALSVHDEGLGLKFRAMMETPGASIILKAHKILEQFVSTRMENEFKTIIDQKWAFVAYDGLWLEPLLKDLNAFINESSKKVNGRVGVTLYKGTIDVVTVRAPKSLFQDKVSLFTLPPDFNVNAIPGYADIYTLQMRLANQVRRNILLSIGKRTTKFKLLAECKKLYNMGYNLYATYKTHKFLKKYGIESILVHKIFEKKMKPNLSDLLPARRFDMIINIPSGRLIEDKEMTDGEYIRKIGKETGIPVFTSVEKAKQIVQELEQASNSK